MFDSYYCFVKLENQTFSFSEAVKLAVTAYLGLLLFITDILTVKKSFFLNNIIHIYV